MRSLWERPEDMYPTPTSDTMKQRADWPNPRREDANHPSSQRGLRVATSVKHCTTFLAPSTVALFPRHLPHLTHDHNMPPLYYIPPCRVPLFAFGPGWLRRTTNVEGVDERSTSPVRMRVVLLHDLVLFMLAPMQRASSRISTYQIN